MPAIKQPRVPAICLRPATVRDIRAILELEKLGFARVEERFNRRQIENLLAKPSAIVIVAEGNNRVLGWAAGLIRRYLKSYTGRVYAVAVHPDARGKGVGQGLVRYILHLLAEFGARRIFLEVNIKNNEAINLYHKLGFVYQRNLVDYYGTGHHGLRMVLLTSPYNSKSD
ncbi:MAG: GNAT family N-acetyltransferase [Candidatus Loosdrechtia sp.]|uniref:GNAT family N-acetyltransferase n=1 Tax=Candidatus Loosdrechtia sp. TaxID=3101272 RepID=UPI003A70E5CF|nr:MAG: GNAT family N-acetyltransferase [Candidatus Jettenia sp. AMX2]